MGATKGSNNGGGRRMSPTEMGAKGHKQKYAALMDAQSSLADVPDTAPKFIPYYGKKMWEMVVPQLKQMNLVKKIDQATIEMMCESYDTYRRAYKKLSDEDYTVSGRKNPLFTIMSDEKKVMLQCSRELGLTYSSRAAMLQDQPNKIDDKLENIDDPMQTLRVLAGGQHE